MKLKVKLNHAYFRFLLAIKEKQKFVFRLLRRRDFNHFSRSSLCLASALPLAF